jgi:hypothetical protein
MNAAARILAVALGAVCFVTPALAERRAGDRGQRIQGGGINYAPQPGARVRVDFLEPDGMNNRLSAAHVWPVK